MQYTRKHISYAKKSKQGPSTKICHYKENPDQVAKIPGKWLSHNKSHWNLGVQSLSVQGIECLHMSQLPLLLILVRWNVLLNQPHGLLRHWPYLGTRRNCQIHMYVRYTYILYNLYHMYYCIIVLCPSYKYYVNVWMNKSNTHKHLYQYYLITHKYIYILYKIHLNRCIIYREIYLCRYICVFYLRIHNFILWRTYSRNDAITFVANDLPF